MLFRSRSLLERRRVTSESVGTFDAVAVAVDGRDANAQVFQVRDGVLAERQGFYLAGEDEVAEGDRDPGEVAETFLLQYYGAAPAIPGRVIVGPEMLNPRAIASWPRRTPTGPRTPPGRHARLQDSRER